MGTEPTSNNMNTVSENSNSSGNTTPRLPSSPLAHNGEDSPPPPKGLTIGVLFKTVFDQWEDIKGEIKFLLKWSWPTIISNLLNNVSYLFINLIFVGRLSSEEMAAAALANTWTYGTQSLALGINNAMDTFVSQSFGARNYVLVGLTVQRATLVTTIMSILVGVLWCLTELFLKLVAQDAHLSYLAWKYVLYLLPGLWFSNVINVLQKYLQGQGIMMPSIYIGLILNALNVLFNFVFTVGIGGYEGIGYIGSPIATSISRVISFFLMLAYIKFFNLHRKTWFGWSWESLNWEGLVSYLKLGIPASIQHTSEAWGFEILTILAGLIDPVSLDAHSACYNFTMLTYQIPSGIAVAVSVRVGQLLGSCQGFQARRSSWVGFFMTLVFMIAIAIAQYTTRFEMGKIYTHNQDIIDKVAEIMPIAALFQVFDGGQTIFQGVVRGMGRIKTGAIANFIAFYVISIPLGAIFTFPVGYGVRGLWWGLCVGLVFICVGLGVILIKAHWPTEVEKTKERTKSALVRVSMSYLQKHRGSISSLDQLPQELRPDFSPVFNPNSDASSTGEAIINNSKSFNISVSSTSGLADSNGSDNSNNSSAPNSPKKHSHKSSSSKSHTIVIDDNQLSGSSNSISNQEDNNTIITIGKDVSTSTSST